MENNLEKNYGNINMDEETFRQIKFQLKTCCKNTLKHNNEIIAILERLHKSAEDITDYDLIASINEIQKRSKDMLTIQLCQNLLIKSNDQKGKPDTGCPKKLKEYEAKKQKGARKRIFAEMQSDDKEESKSEIKSSDVLQLPNTVLPTGQKEDCESGSSAVSTATSCVKPVYQESQSIGNIPSIKQVHSIGQLPKLEPFDLPRIEEPWLCPIQPSSSVIDYPIVASYGEPRIPFDGSRPFRLTDYVLPKPEWPSFYERPKRKIENDIYYEPSQEIKHMDNLQELPNKMVKK